MDRRYISAAKLCRAYIPSPIFEMSVASSAASCISVAYDGQVMSLEDALDKAMKGIQQRMNDLHFKMTALAALTEQEVDDESDFKESVEFEDVCEDLVDGMIHLLKELPDMAAKIRGTCPKECREWYKLHRAERKAFLAKLKEERKISDASAAAALKALGSECKEPTA